MCNSKEKVWLLNITTTITSKSSHHCKALNLHTEEHRFSLENTNSGEDITM